MNMPMRPTWIEVDRGALTNNVQTVRKRIGAQCLLMAVVKGNAYGHGAVETAKVLLAAGADRLAVATLTEGIEFAKPVCKRQSWCWGIRPPGWRQPPFVMH